MPHTSPLSAAEKREISALLAQGWTPSQIAKKFNISRSSVYWIRTGRAKYEAKKAANQPKIEPNYAAMAASLRWGDGSLF